MNGSAALLAVLGSSYPVLVQRMIRWVYHTADEYDHFALATRHATKQLSRLRESTLIAQPGKPIIV